MRLVFPGDATLAAMTRVPGVRRWAARRAAARGMHAAALRGADDDAYVLARLGLHPLARNGVGEDRLARVGRAIARAALGEHVDVEPWGELAAPLVAAMAPHHPARAAIALPRERRLARAACWLAAGEQGEAALALGDATGREAEAIRAALAIGEGDRGGGIAAINAMFAADGIAAPLAEDAPTCALDQYRSPDRPAEQGPLVSVIVPIHADAATVGCALEALTRQSWRALDIVVVDDRSNDEGPAITRQWMARDDRIRLLANARAPGVYGARNTGIAAARGDYIAFLDADDWSPAERTARQVGTLGRLPVSVANHIRVSDQGAPLAPRVFPIVRPVPITLLAARETLIAAGPFDEVATGADSEMLGRLETLHGRRAVARDPAVLLVARWRAGSLSQAGEGGLFGAARHAYRAQWMFRHAGLAPPLASAAADALDAAPDDKDGGD